MDKTIFERLLNRRADSHKYDYGHVLVIGGAPGMVGAPFLAASAALRAGAGLVTIASTTEVIDKLETRVIELMTLRLPNDHPSPILETFIEEHSVSVIVIGPGTKPAYARKMLELLGASHLPVIIDGGALTALAEAPELFRPNFILTPHSGEFRRFEGFGDPANFALKHKIVLVLKGSPTRIYAPGGKPHTNTTGGPALATAGTGDVLSGLIAGIVAQKIEPFAAAQAAVYLGGLAGDAAAAQKTSVGVVASDVIDFLPDSLKLVSGKIL